MSVEKNRNGSWTVRWREGGRNRSRVIGRKRDAEAFDAEIRRRKRLGELAMMAASLQALDEFAQEWWELHARPNLSPRTRAVYASLWDKHVSPRLGGLPLRDMTAESCQRFAAELAAAGVGPAARRKTLGLVGAVLQRAEEWGRIQSNPMRLVRKPPAGRERAVQPLAPLTVERMRAQLAQRDAALVSVLAYCGTRPGEALALRWGDIRERTLLVERAVAGGQIKATKTGQRRSARLMSPLRQDLAEWRIACGRPAQDVLIFPSPDGRPWSDDRWRNWRNRVYKPAAASVGIVGGRPYDLRHSAASLWVHEGRSVIEVATWLGHKATMTLETYSHVIADLGDERRAAEAEIGAARDEVVRLGYVRAVGS